MFCCLIEVTMTVVKSVSAGLRDSESETQLNLNRPLRISPGPRHLSRPLAVISTSDNRPVQVPLAWGENSSSEQHSSPQAPNVAADCCTQGDQQRAQQGKQQRAQQGKQQRSGVQQQWHACYEVRRAEACVD